MKAALFLLAAGSAFGYQSLSLPANSSLVVNVPNGAPFTALADYRLSFRLHDWSLPSSGSVFLLNISNGLKVSLNSTGMLCGLNYFDASGGYGNGACISIAGYSDIVIRIQRFGASPVMVSSPGSMWIEAEDLTTGNLIPQNCGSWPAIGCPMGSGTHNWAGSYGSIGTSVAFSIAWLKWWSTTVLPENTGFENETTPADLADFRFEGNYTNQSTGNYAVTLNPAAGSPAFAATPLRPPVCVLQSQVFRAGAPNQRLLNYSFPLDGGSGLTYFWQLTNGRSTLLWTSHTAASPAVSGGVFGPYVFSLTVTDSHRQSSTCSIKDGFVATDQNGIVDTGNSQVNTILGPMAPLYGNPWPWYDERMVAEATVQTANLSTYYGIANGFTPSWNTPGPGTITVTSNSTAVLGSGTTFTTTFCQGPSNPTVPKSNARIVVWYPQPALREGSGRRQMWISSCTDDHHLTLGRAWNDMGFLTAGSGWSYSYLGDPLWSTWFSSSAPANFYDIVLAFYSLYYRSGIDDYQTVARLLADNFWQLMLDSGRDYFYGEGYNTFEHQRSVLGMALRAIDGRPDMWPGIEMIAAWNYTTYDARFNAYGNWTGIGGNPAAGFGDPREDGYALGEMAYCALFDPTPANAANCRGYISEVMNRGWTASRFPDGNFYSLYWGGMGGGPSSVNYAGFASGTYVSLTNGSSAVTCVNGTGTCNFQASVFSASTPVWFVNSTMAWPTSNADGDTAWYCPVYVDSSHLTLQDCNGNVTTYQGTTGSHGWVVSLNGAVGFGIQPYMLGVASTMMDFTAKAMTCTAPGVPANCDNTVAANAHTYNVAMANYIRQYGYWPAAKGMYYFAGFVDCPYPIPASNTTCTLGFNADQARNLSAEALRGVMSAFSYNADANLQSFGDTLYNAMWNKGGWAVPAGFAFDGTYEDGYENGFGWYMSGTPPTGTAHKYFGMGWGISAGSAWPGYRLGGLAGSSMVTTQVAVNLASVPKATRFNLLVTYPSGITASTVCVSSPCPLRLDQTRAGAVIYIQYIGASGNTVAIQDYPLPIWLN